MRAGPSNTPGTPRWKDISWTLPPRSTSTSSRADSALTTEAPTPCRPPDALYEPPPNLPPACSLVITTSRPVSPVLGSMSTGMPRPSSRTSSDSSGCRTTVMCLQWPASASSTALSMISHTQCCRPAAVGRPDVHAGALADGLEPLEDRQVTGGVVGSCGGQAGCSSRSCGRPTVVRGADEKRPGHAGAAARRAPRSRVAWDGRDRQDIEDKGTAHEMTTDARVPVPGSHRTALPGVPPRQRRSTRPSRSPSPWSCAARPSCRRQLVRARRPSPRRSWRSGTARPSRCRPVREAAPAPAYRRVGRPLRRGGCVLAGPRCARGPVRDHARTGRDARPDQRAAVRTATARASCRYRLRSASGRGRARARRPAPDPGPPPAPASHASALVHAARARGRVRVPDGTTGAGHTLAIIELGGGFADQEAGPPTSPASV